MNKRQIASQLEKIAKSIMATPLDELSVIVQNAKSFMDIGRGLKAAGFKYDFSTDMIANYMVVIKGSTWWICNKKYMEDADVVIGDVAIGKM